MFESPFFVGITILAIVTIAFTLLIAFNINDRLFLVAKLIFVVSAGTALWGGLAKNAFTEYAVWMMYLSGFALISFMLFRIFRKSFVAALLTENENSSGKPS